MKDVNTSSTSVFGCSYFSVNRLSLFDIQIHTNSVPCIISFNRFCLLYRLNYNGSVKEPLCSFIEEFQHQNVFFYSIDEVIIHN